MVSVLRVKGTIGYIGYRYHGMQIGLQELSETMFFMVLFGAELC